MFRFSVPNLVDRSNRHCAAALFTSKLVALVALKRIDEFKGHLDRFYVATAARAGAVTADDGFGKSNHALILQCSAAIGKQSSSHNTLAKSAITCGDPLNSRQWEFGLEMIWETC